jgi:hypothetical protein
MTTLDAYAKQKGYEPQRCGVCSLPDEIREGIHDNEQRSKPYPRRIVASWATDATGRPISADMIYKHLNH